MLNGGKGSGNWGHSGRPGKVGGSGNGTPGLGKVASDSIEKAKKAEPEVTADLDNALKDNGARFEGLDHRLKGQSSLVRKIKTDASGNKDIKVLKKSADAINDNLRYTAILDDNKFGDSYKGIVKNLEGKGYEVVKVKNTMGDLNGGYRGVNTQVRDKNGYIFELQFHTKASFDTKSEQHKQYEIVRSETAKESQKVRARKEMAEAYLSIPMPTGVNDIKSFNKLKNSIDFCKKMVYNRSKRKGD